MTELVLRMVMSLAVVLGLLLIAIRFAGRKYRNGSTATVSVLHRQALTRGSGVTVVKVGSRVLVLGTTEQQVRVLAELDPSELEAPAEVGEGVSRLGASAPHTSTTGGRAASASERRRDPVTTEVGEGVSRLGASAPHTSTTGGRAASASERRRDPVTTEVGAGVSRLGASAPHTSTTGGRAASASERRRDPVTTEVGEGVSRLGASAPHTSTTSITAAPYADFAAALLAELSGEPAPAPLPEGRHRAATTEPPLALAPSPEPVAHQGRLSGSILSPQTWRQARAAVGRRAS